MANEKIVLLQDVIEDTAQLMSLPTTRVYALNERGYAEQFQRIADNDTPVICYSLAQQGEYDLQANGKLYLQYSTTLLFLDFSDDNPAEIQALLRQMHKVGAEFLQRMQRHEAFDAVPDNLRLSTSNFAERVLIWNSHLSGLQYDFNLKIDPNITTPAC